MAQQAAGGNAWTPADTIAVVAILASVAGILLTYALSLHARRRELRQDRREARQQEAGSIAGLLKAFVEDMSPGAIQCASPTGRSESQKMDSLLEQWPPLRARLYALELTHFDPKVRSLSGSVAQ